jgi:magnesium-transporting ATPase (P-type)
MVSKIGYNYDDIRKNHPESEFHKVYPFNSTRKSMSTVIRLPNRGYRVFIKGATELILSNCSYAYGKSRQREIVPIDLTKYSTAAQSMAKKGYRTICIAYKDYVFMKADKNQILVEAEPDWEENSIMSNLTCLAVVGIADPIRPEVPDTIEKCNIRE